MKFAIFGAALAATFALGGAPQFLRHRPRKFRRPWKDLQTQKVPSAEPSLGPRPSSALDNGRPGAVAGRAA